MAPLADRQLGVVDDMRVAEDEAQGVAGVHVQEVRGRRASGRLVEEAAGAKLGGADPGFEAYALRAVEEGIVGDLDIAVAIEVKRFPGKQFASVHQNAQTDQSRRQLG